jgi:glutaredoxin 3
MAEIIFYSRSTCPYCQKAKRLLDSKSVLYTTVDADKNWDEMVRVTGGRTVPQIIINGQPVGGCDDVHALDRKGELDRLLAK